MENTNKRQYITTEDICDEIKKGEKVKIIPEYSYVMGTFIRVKEYFSLKPGEVVIQKVKDETEEDEKWFFRKTQKKHLKEI